MFSDEEAVNTVITNSCSYRMASEQPPPYSTDPSGVYADKELTSAQQDGGGSHDKSGDVTIIINDQFQPGQYGLQSGYPEQPPGYVQDVFPGPMAPPPGYNAATKTVSNLT